MRRRSPTRVGGSTLTSSRSLSARARKPKRRACRRSPAVALPPLREEEARRGAALHRIALAREALEAEEKRAKEREAELDRRIAQFTGDLQREESLIADAAGVMDRLAAEEAGLTHEGAQADEDAAQARAAEESAQRRLASAESALAEAQAAASDLGARRRAMLATLEEEGRRLTRLEAEYAGIERERGALSTAGFEEAERAARAQAVAEAVEALAAAERETQAAEQRHAEAREIEARHRGPLADAERAAQTLETEARTVCWPPRLRFERPVAARGRRGQCRARL